MDILSVYTSLPGYEKGRGVNVGEYKLTHRMVITIRIGGHCYRLGALDGGGGGGPQCRMSILRNGNVACLYRLFSSFSHVEFQKLICHMSLHL